MTRAALLVLAIVAGGTACGRQGEAVPAAQQLERRLLAPCCWRQTLEDHDSPAATALRSEIQQRLAAREPASAIEADLVARYGDKLRALPPGGDPRWVIGIAALGAMIVSMLAIVGTVRRRGRRPAPPPPIPPLSSAESLAYADRLDDELAELD